MQNRKDGPELGKNAPESELDPVVEERQRKRHKTTEHQASYNEIMLENSKKKTEKNRVKLLFVMYFPLKLTKSTRHHHNSSPTCCWKKVPKLKTINYARVAT